MRKVIQCILPIVVSHIEMLVDVLMILNANISSTDPLNSTFNFSSVCTEVLGMNIGGV